MNDRDSLLLVLPVPFLEKDGKLFVEAQAANGLAQWAENFSEVTLAASLMTEGQSNNAMMWKSADELEQKQRLNLVPLPQAYTLVEFTKRYRNIRHQIAQLIERHRYLSFAIYELIGDWASVACLEAIRQRRPYSVWTDNVCHDIVIRNLAGAPLKRRIKARVTAPIMRWYHNHLISKCALGLFHGADCFDAYAPYCRNPHLVHDIHVKAADQIADKALSEKLSRIRRGEPLRIVYAGRTDRLKAPLDWIMVLRDLKSRGVAFEAVWYGDGPLLQDMKFRARELGLADVVRFPGFVKERGELLAALRAGDIFPFCHIARESPRCLIEALKSGTPIIGYDGPYPRDLTSEHGGGIFVPMNDPQALAAEIAELDSDRERLAALIRAAAVSGESFDDVSVFRHRSELIKTYS